MAPPDLFHPENLLVLFDGECGLCNGAVRWLLRRDRATRLVFAPQESAAGAAWRQQSGITADSIVVVAHPGRTGQRVLAQSDAVLAILQVLPAPWPACASLARIVPRPLRNLVYRLVAQTRYRIWGRLNACPLPAPPDRARFL
jgi:predicted DCC family thiol-disulfide oxidoreductase YuxK